MDPEHSANRTHAWSVLERTQNSAPSENVISDLKYLLVHPYQWFRIEAAEKLGALKATGAILLLTAALNDRSEFVAAAAAGALAKMGTTQALDALRCSFEDDQVERPHYLANAISQFGQDGFDILQRCVSSSSATLRYFAARGLGASGRKESLPLLEQLAKTDSEKTRFGGMVSTGAKEGLKTLKRMNQDED